MRGLLTVLLLAPALLPAASAAPDSPGCEGGACEAPGAPEAGSAPAVSLGAAAGILSVGALGVALVAGGGRRR